jgi:NADH-quinone oxidoreductase subunit L
MSTVDMSKPGFLYVVATLLPCAVAAVLMLAGLLLPARRVRPYRGWLCVLGVAGAAVMGVFGLFRYLADAQTLSPPELESQYTARFDWAVLPLWPGTTAGDHARALQLGYRIDALSAVLFAMVTFVAFWIFLFATGYMKEEGHEDVHDHVAHIHRVGRHPRFFLFLSLFTFSMLNLLIADNLFQVFISWELVGVCSFFLIGFYLERPRAGLAANKAFLINRVGDAGFLIGLAIVYTSFGTLNFQELARQVRCPAGDTHRAAAPEAFAGQFVRGDRMTDDETLVKLNESGRDLLLFPAHWHAEDLKNRAVLSYPVPPRDDDQHFKTLPYVWLIVMGLGIFLGCVGKSGQFPLHTWLPDAMEGPTPVSALIHAATMVAAGVYLVGRCFFLLAPEVLQVVACVGCGTALLAAMIATVQTDIKRVLAYSTVSQLGFMMLALGCGAWQAGLLHLVTHAFFKALLFLCAGSVIHACHHEQDLWQLGGLRRKMPVTAIAMLVGVCAIAGVPFFSGWYSKEMILTHITGYGLSLGGFAWIFLVVAFLTAILTAYYMLRLWLLAFAGPPRGEAAEHAIESPWVMTLPLIVLAGFSVVVASGWPIWDVEASALAHVLERSTPKAAVAGFEESALAGHAVHTIVTLCALTAVSLGFGLAVWRFGWARLAPGPVTPTLLTRALARQLYFDEIYAWLFQRPAMRASAVAAQFDRAENPGRFHFSMDGLANRLGRSAIGLGGFLQPVQNGQLRKYVFWLALTAGTLFAILSLLRT